MIEAAVLTASDRSSRGEREDRSGILLEEKIKKSGGKVIEKVITPDDRSSIEKELVRLVDNIGVDLVITTGGTGLSPRDNTPDATLAVIDKEVPGMAEAMRYAGMAKTPHAMLSRAVCGVRKQTLIVNMPGSPGAVEENFEIISRSLSHAIEVLQGKTMDCYPHEQ